MKRIFFFFSLLIISTHILAQTGIALKYFNKGLKYFQDGQYKLADSLFKLSIDIEPSINAYYNLALVKNKLKDSIGCCDNFKKAADMGDYESYKLYESYCSLSNKFYVMGVQAYKNADYVSADTLFAKSVKLDNNSDAYYNLAMIRLRFADTCGYCSNLKSAWKYGDKESKSLFIKYCLKIDTIKINLSLKDEYKRYNLIKSSTCPEKRTVAFYKINHDDTISKYLVDDLVSGYIIDIDSVHQGLSSKLILLKIDSSKNTPSVFAVNKVDTISHKDNILITADEMPSYLGGEDAMYSYLAYTIRYPQVAKENGIMGTVIVSFIVETDGSLSEFEIVKDIGGGCGDEALRVIKQMPKWKPGKIDNVPVRVQFNLPIHFSLE